MKRLLIAALIAGLMAAPAYADPGDYADIDPHSMSNDDLAEAFSNLRDAYMALVGEEQEETEITDSAVERIGSGQHKVGVDMPAGDYVVFSTNSKYGGAYFLSNDSNNDDIIAWDSFYYNSLVHCPEGTYLKLSEAYAVSLESNPDVDTSEDGMFIVGLHIPAGEYKLETIESQITSNLGGSYFIFSDITQDDIVAYDIFDSNSYVTVEDGQILKLSGSRIIQ